MWLKDEEIDANINGTFVRIVLTFRVTYNARVAGWTMWDLFKRISDTREILESPSTTNPQCEETITALWGGKK